MARFISRPGDRVLPCPDEPEALLIFDGVPDDVRLPPELGGTVVKVKHGERRKCPCGKHEALVLVLNDPTGIRVAECPAHGYLWFR